MIGAWVVLTMGALNCDLRFILVDRNTQAIHQIHNHGREVACHGSLKPVFVPWNPDEPQSNESRRTYDWQ